MAPTAPRRAVEESLGDAVVKGIDAFVFRDIEDDATAVSVFDFVADPAVRQTLGGALRGVRWQQKVGLVLARYKGHPAHSVQIRSQVIEYGAIAELALHEAIRQERSTGVPGTFRGLIARAGEMGILDEAGVAAAERRREARNCVHLTMVTRPPKVGDSARALKDFTTIVNQCRASAGLAAWHPTKPRSTA